MDFGWQCHSVTYPGGRVEVMNGGFHSQAGNPVTVTDLDGNVREYRGITDGELAEFRAWVGVVFEECEPVQVQAPHGPRELTVSHFSEPEEVSA